MILPITSSQRAEECRAALESACGETVECVVKLSTAVSRLRQDDFTIVVIDQNLIDPDAQAPEVLIEHLGTAVPVYVNFAVSSVQRVVREVQMGQRRSQVERMIARRAEMQTLRCGLRDALTGILLSSRLALSVPALPEAVQNNIRSVCELAESMRQQLEPA